MDKRGTAEVPVVHSGEQAELPSTAVSYQGDPVDLKLASRQPISGSIDDVLSVSPFDAVAARRAGLLGLVVGGLFLCAAQWQLWATNGLSMLWALVGAIGAIAALIGMWSAANRYHAPDAAMAWAVVWLGAIAAAGQWISLSPRTNSLGLPHLAAAAAAVCAGALCALLITRGQLGVFSAITSIAAVVALVAAVAQYTTVATSAIAAGVVVVGLIALSAMPRVALKLAQISLLPVSRVSRNLYVTREFTDVALFALQTRIRRAATLRSALTPVAAGIVAVAAAWTLDPHSHYVPVQIGIVACTVLILVFRGRTMADRRQAYATCAAAAVATFVSAARLILAWPTGWRPLLVMSVVAVVVAIFVIATVVIPRRPVGPMLLPVAQRLAQQIEAIAIVLAILLCVWVSGVFGLIRNVTFGAS
jgi:type VII secretion integral membrane protein EccD